MRGNCLYYRKEEKDGGVGGGKTIIKSHCPALKVNCEVFAAVHRCTNTQLHRTKVAKSFYFSN